MSELKTAQRQLIWFVLAFAPIIYLLVMYVLETFVDYSASESLGSEILFFLLIIILVSHGVGLMLGPRIFQVNDPCGVDWAKSLIVLVLNESPAIMAFVFYMGLGYNLLWAAFHMAVSAVIMFLFAINWRTRC